MISFSFKSCVKLERKSMTRDITEIVDYTLFQVRENETFATVNTDLNMYLLYLKFMQ